MKRKLLACVFLCMFLVVISGCRQLDNSKPTKEEIEAKEIVTINVTALKGPTIVGMVKMIEEEPFLGENVVADYSVAQSPDILVSKLLSGEVDIATIPTNLAAKLYNKGIPYQLAVMNTWGVLYVLSNGVEVENWEDLKGKKINLMAKGATPDIVLRYLLSKNGIDPDKDVSLEYTSGHIELAQKMIAGKAALAVMPEPWVTKILHENSNVRIVLDLQDEWKKVHGQEVAFAQACLVVKKDLAEKYPGVIKTFLEEYEKSIDWVNQNPAAAGVLAEKHGLGMKARTAEDAIPRCNIRYMDAWEAKPAIEKFLTVLMNFSPETIGGRIPDEGFFFKK